MTTERVGIQAVVAGGGSYVAETQRLNAATRSLVQETQNVERTSRQMAQTLRESGGRLREAGTQAVFLGAALASPGALALRAAISFESAFAGVRKTVDATEAEFAVLREGILNLSGVLPTSANEIASVAEAAGQLGIANESILEFTETVVKLGATTNLSSNEAAVSLARFANIVQLPQDRIDNLGSTIVALGNNLATTEAEIVDFALRIAGAGDVVGLSEDQILAFAAALSSVGLRSEAGGTAISRVFVEIASAVDEGGAKLQQFADVAGLSAEEFRRAFEEDAAAATITFIEGLGRINTEGGSVFAVLEDLSLADTRLRDALLRAAGAGDLLRDSLGLAATAAAENTALTEEFNRRVETTAAQLRLLVNDLARAALEASANFLPALRFGVNVLRDMVGAFNALPAPVRTAVAGLSLFGGTLIIVGGTMAIFAGTIATLLGSAGFGGMGLGAAAAGRALIGLRTTLAASAASFVLLSRSAGIATASLTAFRVGLIAIATNPIVLGLTAIATAVGVVTFALRDGGDSAQFTSERYRELVTETEALVAGRGDLASGTDDAASAETTYAEQIAATRDRAAELRLELEKLRIEEEKRARGVISTPETEDLTADQIERQRELFDEFERRQAREQAAGTGFRATSSEVPDFVRDITGIVDANDRIGVSIVDLIRNLNEEERALLAGAIAAEQVRDADRALAAEKNETIEAASRGIPIIEEEAASQRRLADLQREWIDAANAAQQAQRDLEAARNDGNVSAQELAEAEDRARAATDRAADALSAYTGPANAAAGAAVGLAGDQDDLAAAFDRATEAARRQRLEIAAGFAPSRREVQEAEGAPRGFAPAADVQQAAIGAGFTADEANQIRQEGARAAQARVAEQVREAEERRRAGERAAREAESARSREERERGPTRGERITAALADTYARQLNERAEAFFRGGSPALREVIAEQRELDTAFLAVADDLRALGVLVPEEMRDMFDRTKRAAEEEAEEGNRIGGLLGFLIARRLGQGLDPGGGLIAPSSAVMSEIAGNNAPTINIEEVNVGAGMTTGDVAQGVGAAYRGTFGAV